MRRLIKFPLVSVIKSHIVDYPTPSNLNYFWGFGSLAGMCLVFQILSGVLLAMHYTPHVTLAFNSVEHIMRDVKFGWLIRYTHANGASIFFIIVYIHIGRGLYFKSYYKMALWFSGIVIFILMMATAFTGYVLPWGQMSFWGATVITSLFGAIPVIGGNIAEWLWGGFSIDNATLNRFFSLHYLLPFLIAGLSIVHLALLHVKGSNNPLGICTKVDNVTFYPYFVIKDLFGFFAILVALYTYLVFFNPNMLGHPDNYIMADALVTPAHIVPEWYFLPFYAILRAIPDKLGGVVCMFAALLILFALPFVGHFTIRSAKFNKTYQFFFWLFVYNFFLLGWLGAKVVEQPYVILSQLSAGFYFSFLVIIIPILCFIEKQSVLETKK